jgi:hypothetical protein
MVHQNLNDSSQPKTSIKKNAPLALSPPESSMSKPCTSTFMKAWISGATVMATRRLAINSIAGDAEYKRASSP